MIWKNLILGFYHAASSENNFKGTGNIDALWTFNWFES